MTSRGWVFTINNYTEGQIKRGRVWLETAECIGISAGLEIGKEETPHIQGYVRLGKSVRKSHFQKIIGPGKCGSNKFWMTKANADWTDNAKYTSKDDNVVWHKVPPESEQGKRNDLGDFREAVKRGADDMELFDKHIDVLAKYPKLESRLKQSFMKESTRPFRRVEVHVRWGEAGTGKSREPYELGAYKWNDYEDGWWDGYDGEKAILIDDFYGGIKYTKLLTILDGYQERLKIKGGFTYANWDTIYITSNQHPDDWYPSIICPKMRAALNRRITSVQEFKN